MWADMPTHKLSTMALLAVLFIPALARADPHGGEMVPPDDLELAVGRTMDPSMSIMLSDELDGSATEYTYNFPAEAGYKYVISTERVLGLGQRQQHQRRDLRLGDGARQPTGHDADAVR